MHFEQPITRSGQSRIHPKKPAKGLKMAPEPILRTEIKEKQPFLELPKPEPLAIPPKKEPPEKRVITFNILDGSDPTTINTSTPVGIVIDLGS